MFVNHFQIHNRRSLFLCIHSISSEVFKPLESISSSKETAMSIGVLCFVIIVYFFDSNALINVDGFTWLKQRQPF